MWQLHKYPWLCPEAHEKGSFLSLVICLFWSYNEVGSSFQKCWLWAWSWNLCHASATHHDYLGTLAVLIIHKWQLATVGNSSKKCRPWNGWSKWRAIFGALTYWSGLFFCFSPIRNHSSAGWLVNTQKWCLTQSGAIYSWIQHTFFKSFYCQ